MFEIFYESRLLGKGKHVYSLYIYSVPREITLKVLMIVVQAKSTK